MAGTPDVFGDVFTDSFDGGSTDGLPFVPPRDATDVPQVAVWRYQGSMQWVKVGRILNYTDENAGLTFAPTFQDRGNWQVTVPWSKGTLLLPNRLVTIDWRGVRSTWLIETWNPAPGQQDGGGQQRLIVTGPNAKAMLGWTITWPDATNTLDAQPVYTDTKPAPFKGPAETIARKLIVDNFVNRFGAPLKVASDHGRGTTVPARPQWDNLFELTQSLCKDGGLDWNIGLENLAGDDMHAQLWLRFNEPADKTRSVRLTSRLGTIAAWEQVDTAPTATHALVGYGPDLTGVQTTLAADIGPNTTSLTVRSSKDFPTPGGDTPPFRVVIGDETLRVKSVSGKTWTVDRGVGATTPDSHGADDAVRPTRTYKEVTTPTSLAAGAAWTPWGSRGREVYVAGPDSSDQSEVDASGRAALSDGAETRALSVTASEAKGMRAFEKYNVSDIITMEVESGAVATAPVTSIEVTVDGSGIKVNPIVGNPGVINTGLRQGQLYRALNRAVRALWKRE